MNRSFRILASARLLPLAMFAAGCSPEQTEPQSPAESFERAVAAYQDGAYEQARAAFITAEEMSRSQARRELELQAVVYQVRIAAERGEAFTAVGKAVQGAQLARSLGDFRAEAEVRLLEGLAYRGAGIVHEAERALDDALRIASTFQELPKVADAELALGDLWLRSPDPTQAGDHFTRALQAAQAAGDGNRAARALSGLANVFLRQDKLQEALNSVTQAVSLVDRSDDPDLTATLRMTQGSVLERQGNANAALASYREGVNILRRARKGRKLEALILYRIGSLYASNRRGGDAKKYFGDALEIARRDGDRIAQYFLNVHLLASDVRLMEPVQRQSLGGRIAQAYQQLAVQFSDILHKRGEAMARSLAAAEIASGEASQVRALLVTAADAARDAYLGFTHPLYHLPYVDDLETLMRDIAPSAAAASFLAGEGQILGAIELRERQRQSDVSDQLDGVSIHLRHPVLSGRTRALRATLLDLRLQGAELSARLGYGRPEASAAADRNRILAALAAARAGADSIVSAYPNYGPLLRSNAPGMSGLQRSIPRGTTVVEHLPDGDHIRIIAATRTEVVTRRVPVPASTVRALADEYIRLMLDPMVYRGEGGEESVPVMTRFAVLATQLYGYLLQPVEHLFDRGLIVISSEMLGALPLHALERQDDRGRVEYLIERVSVDYLSGWSALMYPTRPASRLRNIVAFGNPSGKNWSVDYELRDIRSFFRNAEVFTGREATWENMQAVQSDLLQLSSEFRTGYDAFGSFVVSAGEVTDETDLVPFTRLLESEAPPVMMLTDQSGQGNGIGPSHALLLRLNGTSDVFLNRWIADRKAAKFFSEYFFTHLANGLAPGDAYRQALLNLIQDRANAHPRSWAQFFHFGTG